jgi:hypothetical protein
VSDTDTEILERLVTALREYRATLDVAARQHLADVLDGRGLSIAGVTEDPEHDQGARLVDHPDTTRRTT